MLQSKSCSQNISRTRFLGQRNACLFMSHWHPGYLSRPVSDFFSICFVTIFMLIPFFVNLHVSMILYRSQLVKGTSSSTCLSRTELSRTAKLTSNIVSCMFFTECITFQSIIVSVCYEKTRSLHCKYPGETHTISYTKSKRN